MKNQNPKFERTRLNGVAEIKRAHIKNKTKKDNTKKSGHFVAK